MILTWGSYSFADGECSMVNFSAQAFRNENQAKMFTRVRMDCAGEFIFTEEFDQSDISAKVSGAKTALDSDYKDLRLKQGDGTNTPYFMLNSDNDNYTGNVVLYTRWPSHDPEDYATTKRFEFAVQADFIAPNVTYLDYKESLVIRGTTGPIRSWERLINGTWTNKVIHESSTKWIIQSGQATQFGVYPIPASPLLGALYEHEERREIVRLGPSFFYRRPQFYTTKWKYEFETPLVFTPVNPFYPGMA